jgi:dihydrofolate reductase
MEIIHIVCHSKNRVIGKNNSLIWNIPEDMRHFKNTTKGQCVIMGRKTFESLGQKALPNRCNVVLTSKKELESTKDLYFFSSVEESISFVEKNVNCSKIFIIGGQELYESTINMIDTVIATEISKDFIGDKFYPAISKDFAEISREYFEEEGFDFDIVKYKRVNYA